MKPGCTAGKDMRHNRKRVRSVPKGSVHNQEIGDLLERRKRFGAPPSPERIQKLLGFAPNRAERDFLSRKGYTAGAIATAKKVRGHGATGMEGRHGKLKRGVNFSKFK